MSFREFISINEGTQAVLIEKLETGKFGLSFVHYDGNLIGTEELVKYFKTPAKVKKLFSKSGSIRSIVKGKIEFYPGNLLMIGVDEERVISEANNFANYKYYFDGKDWYKFSGSLSSISDFKQKV